MTDCISSLWNLLNTGKDVIKHLGFDVFIDIWSMVVYLGWILSAGGGEGGGPGGEGVAAEGTVQAVRTSE